MNLYFKELDTSNNIINLCHLMFPKKKIYRLDKYLKDTPNAVKITEKEYDKLYKENNL